MAITMIQTATTTTSVKKKTQQSTIGEKLGGRVRENRMSWGYGTTGRWVEFFCEGEDDIGHDDNGGNNEPEDGGDDDGREDNDITIN